RDGGGLLVTGGPHAFGPGGWDGSRLEPLLPVRLDLPGQRDEPALALALVIDRSGSMAGAKMDLTKKAARATADMLPPDDLITVVAFDREATTVVPLQRAANRSRIATDIARIQPTGGTNILAGLREAVDHLIAARAQKKHAILLSDGQSATEGIAELVDAAAASRITVSAVGVGDGADDGLLRLIAGNGGGRYYHTRDPSTIPRIFTTEAAQVTLNGVVEQPTSVVPRKRAALLEGLPLDRAPRLGGYVRTHARPAADLLLVTQGGDPLLARWSLGLGQVAAWTSDLGPRWAAAWARWPPFAKFWGQLGRSLARARAAQQFPMAVRVDAGIASVVVEAVGNDDQFLSGLEAWVDVIAVEDDGGTKSSAARDEDAGGRARRRIALVESAPGRYEAAFGLTVTAGGGSQPAALLLRATLAREGRPVAAARGHVSVPFAPEFRPRPMQGRSPPGAGAGAEGGAPGGPDLLAAIAKRTGGSALASPADILRGAPPRRTSRALRTPLLAALALLFILDVAVRRLAVGRPARPRRARPRVD
ncbi:MAG: VWA domain-containing protein, partial [Pseudomonadota bacterium]